VIAVRQVQGLVALAMQQYERLTKEERPLAASRIEASSITNRIDASRGTEIRHFLGFGNSSDGGPDHGFSATHQKPAMYRWIN